jgi:hypothetical protein
MGRRDVGREGDHRVLRRAHILERPGRDQRQEAFPRCPSPGWFPPPPPPPKLCRQRDRTGAVGHRLPVAVRPSTWTKKRPTGAGLSLKKPAASVVVRSVSSAPSTVMGDTLQGLVHEAAVAVGNLLRSEHMADDGGTRDGAVARGVESEGRIAACGIVAIQVHAPARIVRQSPALQRHLHPARWPGGFPGRRASPCGGRS